VFVGRYDRRLDPKGRVSLPAEFVARLADTDRREVVLAPGQRGCIWLLPKSYWDTVCDRLAASYPSPVPGEFYHHCQARPLDQAGRVLLDDHARKLAGIPDPKQTARPKQTKKSDRADSSVQVTVCGTGRYIQIWAADRYGDTALTDEEFARRLADVSYAAPNSAPNSAHGGSAAE